jgi:glycogen phosphorylase
MKVEFPYDIAEQYSKPVAYVCMEYAIHQPLKLYAGGLGFLAGSHLRSAYELKQNMIGVGILWKYGYYDQVRKQDQAMDVLFQEKGYGFLVKTDIKFTIRVAKHDVRVIVWYLPPSVYKTAPLFLLSTDTEENDYLAATICHRLYDTNPETRIAASILLGVGAARLFEHLDWKPELFHLNEAHALPLAFSLLRNHRSAATLKKQLVFTNHTPEMAGNPQAEFSLLERMDFFDGLSVTEVKELTGIGGENLNYTLAALRLAAIANGVSHMHAQTLKTLWSKTDDICPIIPLTNGQNFTYWHDAEMYAALNADDDAALYKRKQACQQILFDEVADQNGELYDPDIFTLVFAKRFAGYKRPELLLHDADRFERLINNKDRPIQVIWAGKPHPMDYNGIAVFDRVMNVCKNHGNCSILVGYELKLSRLLKQGADAWLNVPRITHEACGTSGMSAAMNGAVNVSIPDGWFPEFARHSVNSFVIKTSEHPLAAHAQDDYDAKQLYHMLENEVIPMFYEEPARWLSVMKNSMRDIVPAFDSNSMADKYYKQMYLTVNENE